MAKKQQNVKIEKLHAELNALLEQCEYLWDCSEPAIRARTHLSDERLAQFWAKHFGVSVERFRAWRDYVGPINGDNDDYTPVGKCSATLRSGKPCSREGMCVDTPLHFFNGCSDRCHYHRRHLTDDEFKQYLMDVMGWPEAKASLPLEQLKQHLAEEVFRAWS